MANNHENSMPKRTNDTENIVLTPVKKTSKSTYLKIERVKQNIENYGDTTHVAGGDHKGIVINKSHASNGEVLDSAPSLTLEFKVFLVNQQNNMHCQEKRGLLFWFKQEVEPTRYTYLVQEFFKDLVTPQEFPRDYVGFIKKIMKLMQNEFPEFLKIGVEITQLEDKVDIPEPPESLDESSLDVSIEVTSAKVLELIERSYPNPLPIAEMAKHFVSTEEIVQGFVDELEDKNFIRVIESSRGTKSYIRVVQNEEEVKVLKSMTGVVSDQQPTIAIITSQYCEKLAVEAMIENREVYVRYNTLGESHAYTLGNIGIHRVVATKLPTVGHSRAAMIATGNTTTRLLGCFQNVEHVILVGAGGGVPNYADYLTHVRLGDIVISSSTPNQSYIYAYCENVQQDEKGNCTFATQTWVPPSPQLQDIAKLLVKPECDDEENYAAFKSYVDEGRNNLANQELLFVKPSVETDRLYMLLGDKDVIEVNHPVAPEGAPQIRKEGCPKIHFGAIGSGRLVVRSNVMRQEFARQYGVLAMNHELDSVVESILGNRKDSYIFIRGVSDYRDGTSGKNWQPYSSLLAAGFMKAVITALPPMDEELLIN